MDYEEEQAMEIEALEAIYMDEFSAKDSKHLEVLLRPHADGEEVNHVAVKLVVKYTPTYPQELPLLDVVVVQGLSEAQRLELMELATSTAQDNVETAMVFAIGESIKEWLVQNNVRSLSEHEQVIERKKMRGRVNAAASTLPDEQDAIDTADGAAADDADGSKEEEPIVDGTTITKENFLEWKLKFDAERALQWAEEDAVIVDAEKAKRLTGKQFFEKNSSAAFLAAIEAEESKASDNIAITSELYDDDDFSDADLTDEDSDTDNQ